MFSGYTEISLSVCPSVHVSIFVQNSSFCQSSDWGIKSYSVTCFVFFALGCKSYRGLKLAEKIMEMEENGEMD